MSDVILARVYAQEDLQVLADKFPLPIITVSYYNRIVLLRGLKHLLWLVA